MSALSHASTLSLEELPRRLIEHWRKVVAEAPLSNEPFGNFWIQPAFPEDVYERLLASMPDPGLYNPLNPKRWARADGTSTRDQLTLTDANFGRMEPETEGFWRAVAHALTSDAAKRIFFAKLRDDVGLRLGVPADEVEDADAWVQAMLVRDIEDYRIKPHTDGFPRVVTLMFYLPEDDSRLDLGTSVYVDKGRVMGLAGKRFKEVDRFPFRRNSAGVFAVNDLPQRRSFHGRELISQGSGVRNSIIQVWTSQFQPGKGGARQETFPCHHELDRETA